MNRKNSTKETMASHLLYKGKLVNVREDTVRSHRGSFSREIVEHNGAVAVVPIVDKDMIIMIRQFRQAAKKTLLELPAGTLYIGETPEDCARRELLEETGYRAGSLKKLVQFYVAPGYNTEVLHVYLATNLDKAEPRLEEDEEIEVLKVNLKETLRMIERNEIEDAKSIAGIMFFNYFYIQHLV